MAKQVSEILVKLGIQGAEGLDKLKSSFRELEKAIGPSNATIEKARRSIIEFGDASDRTEQLIRGQLEAFRGLRSQAEIGSTTYNKLVSSITQLETELRGSSAAIDNQREAILRSTTSSERNADAFRKQIDALKQLQQQTRPGSSAFAQLGRDIDNARNRLTGLASEAQEFSRALNQGFGATPEKLSGQIAALRRGMVGLRFDSEKYLETLERIRLMTITQAGRTGRAEVIAGFQAYQNPTFTGGYASPGRLPELPNTTAALEQQLSELTAELANVERGSARYVDVANRMADIQRELRNELTGTTEAFRKLDIAQAGIERRSEKLAGIQEYYRTQGPLAPGVGGFRDPATGAMIMAGARTPGRIRVEEAAYQAPIGPQPFPEAGRRAQESIQRSLDDVNRIYEDARVRRVEIQSKYDQIHIDKLLEGIDLEGRVREKGFRDELAAFDRQLEARDRRRRRRLTAGQAVQAAGAVISGGIFGGAEGSLGGLGGAILGSAVPGLGTVGGAFAGAAIGAQIGGFRQQLGGFADYAAQIQKMEIALKNASGGGQEFSRAMAAAENATRNLNVPQDVAIQGMTKLTAAVKGAGGQVSDAELVFRNVSSAIKATGGSAEDVDGAITAMVQVFSKGKVSAEELSGQLGERLPGAVTKFAKANEMSLPELQKALEQGQVGLNELMNFIVQLGDEYAGVAEGIAASSQDSGARLTVAFNQMKIAVGEALQPIGAEFQAAFAEFIEKITPTLVEVLPKIGEIALGVARNLDTLAIAAAAAFGVFAVGKIAAVGGLGAALLKVAAAAGTASVSLQALNAAALLNPWTALASGIAAVGVALYNTHKEKQRLNEVLSDGSISQLENEIKRLESEIAKAEAKTRGYGNEVRGMGQDLGIANVKLVQTKQLLESFKAEYRIRVFVDQVFRGAQGTPQGYKTINGRLAYQVPGQGWVDAETSKPISGGEPSKFPSLTDGGGGGAKGKKERESQVPQLLAELAVQEQIARINARARQAVLDNNELLNIRLEGEKRLAEIAGQIRKIDFENIRPEEAKIKRELLLVAANEARAEVIQRLALASKQFLEGTTQPLDELGKKYQEQIDDRIRLKELISEGITESLALEYIAIEKLLDIENEKFEIRVGQLEAEIASGELGKEALARAERELEILKERLKLQGKRGEDAKRKAAEAQPEQKGKLQQFIEEGEASLKDLEGLAVRVSQGIGDAIGSSISNGISGLIEGTTTVKDIFANFLKDVGQILVQEAAKIIATYVAIGIARIFAGFAAGKSSGPNPNPGGIPSTGNAGAPTINGFDTGSISNLAANGAYFANGKANFSSSSPQPFANGGIVNRPTFFRFKDGGAMGGGSSIPFQMGVMGEAGPEAIMPLSRGSDGRLGVTANIPFTKSASRFAAESSESETIASLANPKPIDVRFESQVINNVEYVTAEEYRKGMAQAAERGRSLTLATLQNSVKTRKRVGIG